MASLELGIIGDVIESPSGPRLRGYASEPTACLFLFAQDGYFIACFPMPSVLKQRSEVRHRRYLQGAQNREL